MNPAYLGDSYDVVKRFFCESARSAGYAVYVDPMFTGDWSARQRALFLRFLGAQELGPVVPQSPAALLVDPQDDAALAAAIQRVITEPGLAENLRSLGKVQAARFTWDQCAKQTVGLYRSILTKRT